MSVRKPLVKPVAVDKVDVERFMLDDALAWRAAQWAEAWFRDAKKEAETEGVDARRREIVFAMCLAESYLFEWVLHDVLKTHGDRLNRINEHFKPDERIPIKERWRTVLRRLRREELIRKETERAYSDSEHEAEWDRLITYRNGLMHGPASRPESPHVPEHEKPKPALEVLAGLEPGWALGVVVKRIRRLHKACGTKPPSWLK